MKVLVVGSGGREHALGWKLAQSPNVSQLYFAPGNAGTADIGKNLDVAMDDVSALLSTAAKLQPGLTVVGQEAALEQGIVDEFRQAGLNIFGPSKAAAKLETSKVFSSEFLKRHNIPHPHFTTANTESTALAYIHSHKASSYVIKADGLATGKGVILPKNQAEAETTVKAMLSGKAFGEAGRQIVFQERLVGQEVSAFALSDGENIVMLPFFQDHKPAFDGDKGPNTGGMGAYSPVPIVTKEIATTIEKSIMSEAIKGMRSDGNPYTGVLYGGLIITEDGPKVIEFNARFGDPECQPMMMLLEDDLHELLQSCSDGSGLGQKAVNLRPGAAVAVALASGGYPGKYKKGYPISGIAEASKEEDVVVFHAGTKQEGDRYLTNGGRVLNVAAYGSELNVAIDKAYQAIKQIKFQGMYYRTDIGAKAIK